MKKKYNNEGSIISNKKDFNQYLEEYNKINKEKKIECRTFIK